MNWWEIFAPLVSGILALLSVFLGALAKKISNNGKAEKKESAGYDDLLNTAITTAEQFHLSGEQKLAFAKTLVKNYVLSCKQLDISDAQIEQDIDKRVALTNAVNAAKYGQGEGSKKSEGAADGSGSAENSEPTVKADQVIAAKPKGVTLQSYRVISSGKK